MTSDRFHRAVKDGLLEVLNEATKKECNARDEAGMTPTLWAAFEGNLEALRLLIGRGGNPDKADFFGNSAMHLSAARGHLACVSFLVNFGANVFALDIDDHTPQELAGINNKEDVLRYLDGVTAKMETDKKKAKLMKERAKKEAEKRLKEFNKRQAKAEQLSKRTAEDEPKRRSSNMLLTLRSRLKSGSMNNISGIGAVHPVSATAPKTSFSGLVGGTMTGTRGRNSSVYKKALAHKSKLGTNNNNDDFKIAEIEDGKKSIRSLTGVRRDSEVMYVGSFDQPGKRGKLQGIFHENDRAGGRRHETLTRSLSQPDFLSANLGLSDDILLQEPASIFDRPGIGSIAFRKSITHTLNALTPAAPEFGVLNGGEECSIGSAGSLTGMKIQDRLEDDSSYSESSGDDEQSNNRSTLERFLAAWGLEEHVSKFADEKIDLDALLMLTDADIKTLDLPLGHYRKLVTAISERKAALSNPGKVKDSNL